MAESKSSQGEARKEHPETMKRLVASITVTSGLAGMSALTLSGSLMGGILIFGTAFSLLSFISTLACFHARGEL